MFLVHNENLKEARDKFNELWLEQYGDTILTSHGLLREPIVTLSLEESYAIPYRRQTAGFIHGFTVSFAFGEKDKQKKIYMVDISIVLW